ncbi:hypothetical protein JZ751_013524 [Albula glossodonta]|uniref:Non-specific serine/threonine protein kinase n=1 Tax=Albula glossodonta TaxID=121402 RepID=A0A8T2N0Z7_9TELE|nr:hypothetical protein JZ751_013524 [Albula glossodonta]
MKQTGSKATVSTMDRRNNKLIFKVHFLEMEEKVLVDFRLSKGDGLEFKRHFLKIKRQLSDIVSSQKVLLPLRALSTLDLERFSLSGTRAGGRTCLNQKGDLLLSKPLLNTSTGGVM